MSFEKSEVCNNGLCYAAQYLYLCKGSMLTPLATSNEAIWSYKETLQKKGQQKCFRVIDRLQISNWVWNNLVTFYFYMIFDEETFQ